MTTNTNKPKPTGASRNPQTHQELFDAWVNAQRKVDAEFGTDYDDHAKLFRAARDYAALHGLEVDLNPETYGWHWRLDPEDAEDNGLSPEEFQMLDWEKVL